MLVGPRRAQDVAHRVVAFVARVLEEPVAVVASQRERHAPGTCPRLRIVNGRFVLDRVGARAREALNHLQRIAGGHQTAVPGHANRPIEVRGLHDQRVALPVTARDPHVLTDGLRYRRDLRAG